MDISKIVAESCDEADNEVVSEFNAGKLQKDTSKVANLPLTRKNMDEIGELNSEFIKLSIQKSLEKYHCALMEELKATV